MKLSYLPGRALGHALALLAALMVSACVSVIPGEGTPSQFWYELNDLHALPPPAGPAPRGGAATRSLLIGPVASTAFYDGNMLAFSADGRTRAYYQFAAWTDRPARRLGVLAEKRLANRGSFLSVAQSTSGIRGDLMLNLTLEQCMHDASTQPGEARVTFTAELIDWRSRTLIARRTFDGQAAVSAPSAIAAVNGLSQALTDQLDAFSAWVEHSAASAPPR